MTFTPVLVFAQYESIEDGPASGTVSLTLPYRLTNDNVSPILPPEGISVTLDKLGAMACVVPANDDAGTTPSGTAYVISEKIRGAESTKPWSAVIPHTSFITLLTGTGPPGGGLGAAGDWYLDTAAEAIYTAKMVNPSDPDPGPVWPTWSTKVANINGQIPGAVIDLGSIGPATTGPAFVRYVLGSSVGFPDGVAPLDGDGQIPAQYLANAGTAITATQLAAWTYSQSFSLHNIERDDNEAITTADVRWGDGGGGVYTALVISTDFPGATDSYEITYVNGAISYTITQPTVTRDAGGAVIDQPALIVVSP